MNLIVVMIDTLRQDHVGAYGNAKALTPNLDRFAQRSLMFRRAFPEGLPTINVRRAMFTGRRSFPSLDWRPWRGEIVKLRGWQPLGEEDMSLAEILRANDYICGMVADTHHMFKPGQNFTRGFHAYQHIRGQVSDAYRSDPVPAELAARYCHPEMDAWAQGRVLQHIRNNMGHTREEEFLPARVFSTAADWLSANRTHPHLFLWVDSFDPHEPWDAPQPYLEQYSRDYHGRDFILPREGDSSYLTQSELERCRALYAAEVTFVDKWFGRFMDRVEELGMHENSVILVLGDHGHPLGEHGIISKVPWSIYPEIIDVPFLLHAPGNPTKGTSTNEIVQFHDVLPTLLEMIGVPMPEGYAVDGRSFAKVVSEGAPSGREHFVCGYHENALVEDKEWAYVFTQNPALRKLFHFKVDPDWSENLYEACPDEVARLHGLLKEVVDPEMLRVPVGMTKMDTKASL